MASNLAAGAGPGAGDDGGGGDWRAELPSGSRERILGSILVSLAKAHKHVSHCQELYNIAATFEDKVYREAPTKYEYLIRISKKLVDLDNGQSSRAAPAPPGHQHQMQTSNLGPAIQEINNALVTVPQAQAMPPPSRLGAIPMAGAGSSSSSSSRLACQQQSLNMTQQGSGLLPNQNQNQNIAPYAFAQQMLQMPKQEQPAATAILNQILYPQTTAVGTMASSLQQSQLGMQSIANRQQTQQPAMQLQHAMQLQNANYQGYYSTSATQSQGQPVVRQNAQQNQMPRQNVSGLGAQQRPQQRMVGMNQQNLMINQQQLNQQTLMTNQQQHLNQQNLMINHQNMMVNQDHMNQQNLMMNQQNLMVNQSAGQCFQQNAGPSSTMLQPQFMGYEQEAFINNMILESQPVTQPQRQLTIGQQSGLICQSPQTSARMENADEVDWKEELFQQITALKNLYFADLLEFDQSFSIPQLPKQGERQFTEVQINAYQQRLAMKKALRSLLTLLQVQKSNMNEGLKTTFPRHRKTLLHLVRLYRDRKNGLSRINEGGQPQNQPRQQQQQQQPPQFIDLTGDAGQSASAAAGATTTTRQLQHEHPDDGNIGQAVNNFIRGGPNQHQNHQVQLLGVISSHHHVSETMTLPPPPPMAALQTSAAITRPGRALQIASPRASPMPSALSKDRGCVPSSLLLQGNAAAKSSSQITASVKPPAFSKNDGGVAGFLRPCNAATKSSSHVTAATAAGVSGSVKSSKASEAGPTVSALLLQGNVVANTACLVTTNTAAEDDGGASALLVEGNAAPNSSSHVTAAAVPVAEIPAPPLQEETAAALPPAAMPAQLLQAETTSAPQGEEPAPGAAEPPVGPTKAIDRLLAAVLSATPETLRAAASDMKAVIASEDRAPTEIPPWGGWCNTSNKMKRTFDCVEKRTFDCVASPAGSAGDRDDDAEPDLKKQKTQNSDDSLLNEVTAINMTLIDTEISITDDKETSETSGSASRSSTGKLIKFSYSAVSLEPGLKSLLAPSEMSFVAPAKLIVPTDYPRSSPVLVDDQEDEELKKSNIGISEAVNTNFRMALRDLPPPASIKEMVKAWDACVREAVTEFVLRHGGGTFSSEHGKWQSCADA